MVYCPHCGSANRDGARFCDGCGMEMKMPVTPAPQRLEPPASSTQTYVQTPQQAQPPQAPPPQYYNPVGDPRKRSRRLLGAVVAIVVVVAVLLVASVVIVLPHGPGSSEPISPEQVLSDAFKNFTDDDINGFLDHTTTKFNTSTRAGWYDYLVYIRANEQLSLSVNRSQVLEVGDHWINPDDPNGFLNVDDSTWLEVAQEVSQLERDNSLKVQDYCIVVFQFLGYDPDSGAYDEYDWNLFCEIDSNWYMYFEPESP